MKSSFTKIMKNITEYVMKLWHVMKHSFAPNQDHPTSPPSRCHDFFSFWRLPQPGNSIATKSPYGGDWGMWLLSTGQQSVFWTGSTFYGFSPFTRRRLQYCRCRAPLIDWWLKAYLVEIKIWFNKISRHLLMCLRFKMVPISRYVYFGIECEILALSPAPWLRGSDTETSLIRV